MINWDTLVLGPTMGVFGQPILYTPRVGSPVTLNDAVFDEGYVMVDSLAEPGVTSVSPILGVRLSSMPAGFDAENAQGDRFTVLATGRVYVVKEGRPDSHGWARLDANAAS